MAKAVFIVAVDTDGTAARRWEIQERLRELHEQMRKPGEGRMVMLDLTVDDLVPSIRPTFRRILGDVSDDFEELAAPASLTPPRIGPHDD